MIPTVRTKKSVKVASRQKILVDFVKSERFKFFHQTMLKGTVIPSTYNLGVINEKNRVRVRVMQHTRTRVFVAINFFERGLKHINFHFCYAKSL